MPSRCPHSSRALQAVPTARGTATSSSPPSLASPSWHHERPPLCWAALGTTSQRLSLPASWPATRAGTVPRRAVASLKHAHRFLTSQPGGPAARAPLCARAGFHRNKMMVTMKRANGSGNNLRDRNAFCWLAAVPRRPPAGGHGPGGRPRVLRGLARNAVYPISGDAPCASPLITEAFLSP